LKVVSVIGARPQFIKEALVGRALEVLNIEEIVVHSGQHYDFNMSDIFFEVLEMKTPAYNLGIGSGTHAEQTGKVMIELEKVLVFEKPDLVLVYGDTNTTLAGALTAAKLKMPVAHVEAGLRQEPRDMPEEINRVLTDRISTLKFCPSKKAVENLKKEGITDGVHFTGDVMYDIFLKFENMVNSRITLKKYDLDPKKYVLSTLHRDFNTDVKERLESILRALSRISKRIPVVLPIHPRTRKRISEFGLESLTEGIKIMDPVGYDESVALTTNASSIVTDSGGLQKEAYFAKVPAVVMMKDTGWIELVESKWNVLADADEEKIVAGVFDHPRPLSELDEIYGNGKASQKVAKLISEVKR
jgi:UDP-N-acetylglucosamine 2-epimerase (non-hydrolysing)